MKTKLLILAAALAVTSTSAQQTVFEYSDGLTVKFNPNGTRAGFNVGSHAGDPSAVNNGDAWYNSSSGLFKIRANGQTITLGEADLSNLNASNLTSGTVPDARFPATLPALSGLNLTALNASNLGSGTIPDARFPATLPALSGLNLTALNASNLGSGTIPDARFPATLPALNGSALTALNASNLASGTLPAARFPAFTGDVTTSAGAVATTLATVNANVGSFGNSTAIPTFTVNGKGLITAASTAAVVAPAGTISGTTLAANVTGSSLTSVGTITSGTWNAGIIPGQYGGTGVNNAGKTLTLGGSYTINGTSGSTLDIGAGGTLGEAAYVGVSLGGNGPSDSGKAAQFGVNGESKAAQFIAGTAPAGTLSVNPAFSLTRTYSTTGNAHGFSDESTYTVTGGGYNSFDAIPNVGATGGTYDHHAGFQARAKFRGTFTTGYGYTSQPEIIGAGGVGTFHHIYITDAARSGGATLNTQYGVTINAFTSTNAVSLQSNGASSRMIHNGRVVLGASSFSGLDASAALQINSTSTSGDGIHRGLLLPRMTRANRDAIPTPADGLVIYQTDNTPGIRVRVGGAWVIPVVTADP